MIRTSTAVPIIILVSVPISVALKVCVKILRTTSGLIKKLKKHSEIEFLQKAKLNSIKEKFTKAIKYEKETEEDLNDV
jgi:hypothetical protein